MRSLRPALVVGLLAGGAAFGAAPPARAAACGGSSGVTVVVDARAVGGSLDVRCAPGDPGSGLEALQAAGFSYSFVPGHPGQVCQIDARPNPCTVSNTSYWAYWHADRGGSWAYSDEGAGTFDPPAGSVEGWAFGNTAQPGTAPPAAPTTTTTTTVPPATAAPTTRPPVATTRPPATTAPAPGVVTTAGPTATTAPGATTAPTPATVPGATTASTATDASSTSTATTRRPRPGDERADDAADGDGDESAAPVVVEHARSGGSPLAFVAGVGTIGAVAGAGVLLARRRRPDADG